MVTRAELKSRAREQLKGNVGVIFLCSIIVACISFILGIIPIAGFIGNILVTPVFIFGMEYIYLDLTRQGKAQVQTLFKGFDDFGRVFCIGFFRNIFIFLWTLLFIIPGIIKTISYSMSYYIAIDKPNLSAMETLRESERIMDGHKLDYFVLTLSFILWLSLVTITFGIAAIYVFPYIEVTMANFYNSIKEEASIFN